MSGAQYGERGGAQHASAISADTDSSAIGGDSYTTSSSSRHLRFPSGNLEASSGSSTSTAQSLTSASTLDSKLDSKLDNKLDLSPTESVARHSMLQASFFPEWKDDAGGESIESPEEMQKKDPLGTQVWKLYARAKSQLPNAERMENLTWRMMSMNIRKSQMERERCAFPTT